MTLIPSREVNPTGLHRKYNITRADGSPVDPEAVYFVLRLDGDHIHNQACRAAAMTWADQVLGHPDLGEVAVDLMVLVKLCGGVK